MTQLNKECVILLAEKGIWSDRCQQELTNNGFAVIQQEPEADILDGQEFDDRLFLIPIHDPTSRRLQVVQRLAKLGGSAIVLAETYNTEMLALCLMEIPRTVSIEKMADFGSLVKLVGEYFGREEPGQYAKILRDRP